MSASEQDVRAAINGPQQPENNPWPARLATWKKFSEKFHERGSAIEKRYEDDRDSSTQVSGGDPGAKKVNMFYSNVTVIKESLYNSLPKPSVTRLHTGEWDNDAARVAATIVERGLAYEIKCAPSFDAAVKSSILDRLVPGLGALWVNFTPPTGTTPEHITVDLVYWKDILFEPQRAWEQVTWVGRKLYVENETARARWGDAAVTDPNKNDKSYTAGSVEEAILAGKSCVIEMWDKNTKTVIHMTPEGQVLKTVPDPYQLKKFFPCPRPLIACPPTRKFLPMPDYYMAQDQYMELDILYGRINLIIEAIRVAGVYDSSVPEIQRMLNGNENKLIPVDNWAMFAEKGGTKGVIDWFPVHEVAQVLTQLVSTYSFIKTELFEVSGMADIVRGSTNQYETAAAQQIKAQFASVRLNGFQRDTAVFVRDTIRIIGELMCQLYSDQKMTQIVGTLPEADQEFIPQAAAILRNDYTLYYNVDIESDSLTQADWGLQQEQRQMYAQSLSQFLTAALPVSQQVPALAPLLVQIIKFMSVGFKGSSELEGTLDQALDQITQAPAQEEPAPPDPEVVKAQMEIENAQKKAEAVQAENQLKAQDRAAELQHKRDMQAADLEYKRVDQAMELEHAQKMFTAKLNQQAVEGAVKMGRENEEVERTRAREGEEFEREQGREDLRTNADIVNTAAKTKAATKAKEKKDAG